MRIYGKREKQGFLISGILDIGIQVLHFPSVLTVMEEWWQGGRGGHLGKEKSGWMYCRYILGQAENKVLVGSLWKNVQQISRNKQLELGRKIETNG